MPTPRRAVLVRVTVALALFAAGAPAQADVPARLGAVGHAVGALRTPTGRTRAVFHAAFGHGHVVSAIRRVANAAAPLRDEQGARVDLRAINPGARHDPERQVNCMRTTVAVDRTLAGQPTVAAPGHPPTAEYAAAIADPSTFESTTVDGLRAAMRAAGPGARAAVRGASRLGFAHAFNVVNQHGRVRFVDGQTGGYIPAAVVARFDLIAFHRTH